VYAKDVQRACYALLLRRIFGVYVKDVVVCACYALSPPLRRMKVHMGECTKIPLKDVADVGNRSWRRVSPLNGSSAEKNQGETLTWE
jgi:hypothetical protein